MVVSVKMQINSTDSAGESVTTNVSYISGTLADKDVYEFGKKMNALTTNQLSSVYKITAEDVSGSEE